MAICCDGKQLPALLLGLVMGSLLAGGIVNWISTSREGEQVAALKDKVEAMVDGQARIAAELKALRGETRLAAEAAPIMQQSSSGNPPMQGHYQGATPNGRDDSPAMHGTEAAKNDDRIALAKTVTPTDQEAEQATPIIAKLKSRADDTYPNFPALMSSPEINALSPAGREKVMIEISRMVENGEIDVASFFPQQ